MEPSLQESITSINIYLLWGVGILAGMNALGFSATYLTVVFGALSIGLGFGLQNIFNNFISGLILLFERPIKVGDAVEINGIWGTVTKINVRSTVVQTWDNASLIIPNSEFISTQVTNWTFKDTTLRRHIDVGVAYGSDIHLVRDTLIEIARAHPLVLKRPAPSVLFTDFGDSALMFSLRFWTGINVYLTVETDLRFEIDRLFRERQVEIPFPQQDLHVRTVAPPSVAQPSEPEPPEPPDPPIAADE
ncbi:MAG: potassium transporter KefA [Syntrophobacteraceae bacterium CG2_30_61_12]|nr:MAG: potassium transporter KefA [Syntrophobacteraceae bacterium CG2_30_61_12]PIU31159.1 MAG: potassium transporter KefA [Syntrophobacteraceae bacterium CG07_land_8_20_14_0_80_61_8]